MWPFKKKVEKKVDLIEDPTVYTVVLADSLGSPVTVHSKSSGAIRIDQGDLWILDKDEGVEAIFKSGTWLYIYEVGVRR